MHSHQRCVFLNGSYHQGTRNFLSSFVVSQKSHHVDPRFTDVADEMARTTVPCVQANFPPDDAGKKANLMLYSIIVG